MLQMLTIITAFPTYGLLVAVIEMSQKEVSRSGIVIELIQERNTDAGDSSTLSFTADFSTFSRCEVGQVIISTYDDLGSVVFSTISGELEGLNYFEIRDDFLATTKISIHCRSTGSGFIPKRFSFNLGAAVEAI